MRYLPKAICGSAAEKGVQILQGAHEFIIIEVMKLQSINPHDQSVVGELEISTQQDVTAAISKAKKAFESWRFTPIKKRIKYIKIYREKIVENKEKLARLTTLEMGKPLNQSLDDIGWELQFIDYYIDKGTENLADEVVLNKGKEHYRVVFEPYGVCACIAPWNFPLSMMNSGVLPALIAGNTVIFKPSEYTSLSQKFAADLLIESGLPEGVMQVLIGAGEVGKMLVDADIDLMWFTGSTKVGQEIYKKCGDKFIKALCEMGGSSAGIVFADADLKVTMENLYWARFLNCGQVCSSVKRLFVEKKVYKKVLEQFIDRLKKVKLGNPMENADVGPLVSKKQLDLLELQVKDAVEKGAKVEVGGKKPTGKVYEKGNYFEPTILTNVNFDMKVLSEETFGPVLPIIPFETEDEVIKMANRTQYGLTSEIYTTDLKKGERIGHRLDSGVVAINTDSFYKPVCPIGGYKKSGIGREYGKIGMQEFAQVKLMAVNKA